MRSARANSAAVKYRTADRPHRVYPGGAMILHYKTADNVGPAPAGLVLNGTRLRHNSLSGLDSRFREYQCLCPRFCTASRFFAADAISALEVILSYIALQQ